jgi:hypothetical protein
VEQAALIEDTLEVHRTILRGYTGPTPRGRRLPSTQGEITYTDDSGSTIALTRTGGGYVLRDPTPSDITSIRAEGRGVRISLRSGWSKEFSRVRDSFVLTAVRDAHGNALSFIYQGAQPAEPRTNFHAARCDWTKYSV